VSDAEVSRARHERLDYTPPATPAVEQPPAKPQPKPPTGNAVKAKQTFEWRGRTIRKGHVTSETSGLATEMWHMFERA
jgi:hypothetical protein